jgi:hypothetical protein
MPRQKIYPEADIVRISLRIPDRLKEDIQEEAVLNHRSLNQEIVALIEDALRLREKRRTEEDLG